MNDNAGVMIVVPARSTSTATIAADELAADEELVRVSVLGLIRGLLLLRSHAIGEDQVRR